jgi:hypothetical protein
MSSRSPDLQGLEQLVRDSTASTSSLVELVRQLIDSHNELLETVDAMSEALVAISAEVAALKADRLANAPDGHRPLRSLGRVVDSEAASRRTP